MQDFATTTQFDLIFIKKKRRNILIRFVKKYLTILILHPHPPHKLNGLPLIRQHFVFVVLIKMCYQYASHCIGISHEWVISSIATFEVMVEFCRLYERPLLPHH